MLGVRRVKWLFSGRTLCREEEVANAGRKRLRQQRGALIRSDRVCPVPQANFCSACLGFCRKVSVAPATSGTSVW